jgi:hypothetical protein
MAVINIEVIKQGHPKPVEQPDPKSKLPARSNYPVIFCIIFWYSLLCFERHRTSQISLW